MFYVNIYIQIFKFKENALEVIVSSVLGHMFYPQNRAYNYVYFFLKKTVFE